MNTDSIFALIGRVGSKTIFTISGTEVTLFSIVLFVLALVITIIVSSILQRVLKRALFSRFKKREGTLAALLRLLHYFILIAGFSVGLQIIGISLGGLFATGAVFAIAIGFAMQNILQNFVSGVILLLERSIKPGDVLEVEGVIVKVIDMGIRTTIARTLLDEELIMPNSVFSQGTVKNYTLRDSSYCLGVNVGVAYDSDIDEVLRALEKAASDFEWKLPGTEPSVRLTDFASSSVNFAVYVSIDDPWKQGFYRSQLRQKIWFAFKDAGITISYPQLDVHLDSSFVERVASTLQNKSTGSTN